MSRRRASGFTLITAIFLLVVVAGLVVYVTNIGVAQQTTVVYGLQGARAIQAARSGIEWGIYQSTVNGVCAGSTTINNAAFAGFSVELLCTSTTHTEGAAPAGTIVTYRLIAIATSGAYGSLDYVQRRLLATVSLDPP
jgi:MSHA biogenesis protein MshP